MNGIEWLVDVSGCPPAALQDREKIEALFETVVHEMQLNPIGRPVWHQFETTLGITGLWMLRESHLAIHTFPEHGAACFNLFCCTHRPAMDWEPLFARHLEAEVIAVKEYERAYAVV